LRLGWNLVQLLEPENFTSRSVFGDASVSIPLLRGAGRHIAAEGLTQAERDVVYAIYDFERFKRSFAVGVADQYLSVLQSYDQVNNAEENYRGLIASTRRARRLLDAGDLPPIQVDQSIQDELNARNRWISARESQTAALDSFKALLGLPVDAAIELDRAEFTKLAAQARSMTTNATDIEIEETIPPADAEIVLEEPSQEGAGPFEIEPDTAIRIALDNRLDVRIAEGRVFDAQRNVVVAADRLRTELTLFGSARFTAEDFDDLNFDRGQYEALLAIDLPLERTAEAVAYRNSMIQLEQSVRGVQALEDDIKQDVRQRLRTLREARESLQIQAISVELARRRVRGADLNLQAGRVEIRDLLEAQEDLLSAQNALTGAAVDYRLAELELQRDLDVLEVGSDGLWTEFNPELLRHEESNH
jgi:outer membrane protein TolC